MEEEMTMETGEAEQDKNELYITNIHFKSA